MGILWLYNIKVEVTVLDSEKEEILYTKAFIYMIVIFKMLHHPLYPLLPTPSLLVVPYVHMSVCVTLIGGQQSL